MGVPTKIPLHQDDARTIRIAAIGHRLIAPEVRMRVARTVERILSDIRAAAEVIPQPSPDPVKLVVVSPMAQGADQLIATSALALGYRLAAVLPAAQAEYERTFDLGTEKEDIATFRDLISRAHPPTGEGCLILDGDMSSSDGRDRAFLSCADTVIQCADIVVTILSTDRWQSQSGQTVREALTREIPVIVIAPETPDEAILHMQRDHEQVASKHAIRKVTGALMERKFPNPIAKARSLLAAGDCLTAIDFLRNLSDDAAADRTAERDYLLTLALARTGASRLALETFRSRLAAVALEGLPVALARDVGALEARCLKDLGLETASPEALLTAARAYENVYQRFGGYYPLINAATLTLLGGDHGPGTIIGAPDPDGSDRFQLLVTGQQGRGIPDLERRWRGSRHIGSCKRCPHSTFRSCDYQKTALAGLRGQRLTRVLVVEHAHTERLVLPRP